MAREDRDSASIPRSPPVLCLLGSVIKHFEDILTYLGVATGRRGSHETRETDVMGSVLEEPPISFIDTLEN